MARVSGIRVKGKLIIDIDNEVSPEKLGELISCAKSLNSLQSDYGSKNQQYLELDVFSMRPESSYRSIQIRPKSSVGFGQRRVLSPHYYPQSYPSSASIYDLPSNYENPPQ